MVEKWEAPALSTLFPSSIFESWNAVLILASTTDREWKLRIGVERSSGQDLHQLTGWEVGGRKQEVGRAFHLPGHRPRSEVMTEGASRHHRADDLGRGINMK